MRCDRAKPGRVLGLALLVFGAAFWLAQPVAVAQDGVAEEASEAEDASEAEAEEAWDSPEGEIEPAEEETPADEEGSPAVEPEDPDESEPEAPEETDEEADSPPSSIDEDADEESKWRERHQQMLAAVKDSERRVAEAEAQRKKLGDRYSYGGRSRQQIQTELDAAERLFQRAQRDLDRFYEEARQADVPPGWVREED
jgi:hypothetical protein